MEGAVVLSPGIVLPLTVCLFLFTGTLLLRLNKWREGNWSTSFAATHTITAAKVLTALQLPQCTLLADNTPYIYRCTFKFCHLLSHLTTFFFFFSVPTHVDEESSLSSMDIALDLLRCDVLFLCVEVLLTTTHFFGKKM